MTLHTCYEVSGPKFHINPLSGFEEEGGVGAEGVGVDVQPHMYT